MERCINGGVIISQDYHWHWHFLQAMNEEPFCGLLTYKYVSIGRYPYTRHTILLEEPQSSNKCLWEYLEDEEHGTNTGYTKQQVMMPIVHAPHKYGAAYNAIMCQCLVYPSLYTVEYIFLLYASWCCFIQAVAVSYAKQVVKLMDSGLVAGKVRSQLMETRRELPQAQHSYFPEVIPVLSLDVTVKNKDFIDGFLLRLINYDGDSQSKQHNRLLYGTGISYQQ